MALPATSDALHTGREAVEKIENRTDYSSAHIMRTVRVIGGATIGIAILALVLVEIFDLDAIADISSDDPFGGIVESLETTGASAIGLLVVGLLVLAANRVMGFFGGGGF